MPEVHAVLSASSSKRWLNCTPSARLEQNFPNESSVYAEEGTAAHALGEYKLRKYLHERVRRPTSEFDNEEMEANTDIYAEFIITTVEKIKETCLHPLVMVEERLDYSYLVPQGFGTGDCVVIADGTLYVMDYKNGKGVFVSCDHNPQMMLYALGAYHAYGYDCAIVLIGHLNKKEGTKGLYRSLGSIDVVAAARSVLQVERNPGNPSVRVVRQIKNSLGPDGAEVGFSITEEDGFRWLDSSDAKNGEAQKDSADFKTKAEIACALIRKLLAEGDKPSKAVYEKLSEAGISRRTVAETKKILGIQSYRKMRQWYWTIDGENGIKKTNEIR